MKATQVILQAGKSIGGNKLRTGLTLLIIGLGIAALIGILTLLDGINSSVTKSFSAIGAKVFTIQANGQIGGRSEGRRVGHECVGNVESEREEVA